MTTVVLAPIVFVGWRRRTDLSRSKGSAALDIAIIILGVLWLGWDLWMRVWFGSDRLGS
jgi:hypothetical protein